MTLGVVREVRRGTFTLYLNILLYFWVSFLFVWIFGFGVCVCTHVVVVGCFFYHEFVLFIHITKINLPQKGDFGPSPLPTHT